MPGHYIADAIGASCTSGLSKAVQIRQTGSRAVLKTRRVDPRPEIAIDEQLPPRQCYQVGKGPWVGGAHVQIPQHQDGNQRRPNLNVDGVEVGLRFTEVVKVWRGQGNAQEFRINKYLVLVIHQVLEIAQQECEHGFALRHKNRTQRARQFVIF
ncbi:MAG: hypothetical protein JWO48_406 [Bryobacterales bacterium]|nr:hypothetical protein [Bryobacterales bacterium]